MFSRDLIFHGLNMILIEEEEKVELILVLSLCIGASANSECTSTLYWWVSEILIVKKNVHTLNALSW